MSFLGIDVGTTGCKASVFSAKGECLAFAYNEYDMVRPRPGWLELDPSDVWARVRKSIGSAVRGARGSGESPFRLLDGRGDGSGFT